MIRRRDFSAWLPVSGLSLAGARSVNAQTANPLRMLVGFVPGGTVDVIARSVSEGLRPFGFNSLVDNRPGASGRLATTALLAAPPDGATVMMTPSTNLTLFPSVHANLRFRHEDFAYLGIAAEVQFGLAVPSDGGARTLAEFLERARKDPKAGQFGVPGSGSVMELLGNLLERLAKVQLQSVPYKGGVAAINDALGGVLPAVITALPNLVPMHKSGKLRILAVTSDRPHPALPEVPTFASAGFPDLTASEYLCLVARKGVSVAFVDKMNAEPYVAAFFDNIKTDAADAEFDIQVCEPRSRLALSQSADARKLHVATIGAH